MFKNPLLIMGLALSLNTQANPFNWKNSVRGMATLGTLAITYVSFSMLMNKYPTCRGELVPLNADGMTRCVAGIGLCASAAAVAGLFKHAETIK